MLFFHFLSASFICWRRISLTKAFNGFCLLFLLVHVIDHHRPPVRRLRNCWSTANLWAGRSRWRRWCHRLKRRSWQSRKWKFQQGWINHHLSHHSFKVLGVKLQPNRDHPSHEFRISPSRKPERDLWCHLHGKMGKIFRSPIPRSWAGNQSHTQAIPDC